MKKVTEPEGMRLSTLALTFESARAIMQIIPIGEISTYTQLAKQLTAIAKNKELLKTLHLALDRLNQQSIILGDTTLVRPADHPLFIRNAYVPKDKI